MLAAGLLCENSHCKNVEHSETRDSHMLDILSAIIESSHVTLPTYGGCWVGDKRPGWNSEVKPYRQGSRIFFLSDTAVPER